VWIATAHNVTAADSRPGNIVSGELIVCCCIAAGAVPDNQVTRCIDIDADIVTY